MKHILLAYFATATIYDRKMLIALAAGQRRRRKSFIALTRDIDALKLWLFRHWQRGQVS